uniref:Protein phosphatase inhibitor 2 n=1 Tax=Naja naja TaxID=35670 RepID=A0A8C6XHV4_NAJNA
LPGKERKGRKAGEGRHRRVSRRPRTRGQRRRDPVARHGSRQAPPIPEPGRRGCVPQARVTPPPCPCDDTGRRPGRACAGRAYGPGSGGNGGAGLGGRREAREGHPEEPLRQRRQQRAGPGRLRGSLAGVAAAARRAAPASAAEQRKPRRGTRVGGAGLGEPRAAGRGVGRLSLLAHGPPSPPSPARKKTQKWDEMNILATYHPAGKDYGLMKIDEPSTPYHSLKEEDAGSDAEDSPVPMADVLAKKLAAAAQGQGPKILARQDDSSDEEEEDDEVDLTPEELEKKRQFEMKRKMHYNEAQNIKLARQLIAKEMHGEAAEEEEEEDCEEDEEEDEDDEDEMQDECKTSTESDAAACQKQSVSFCISFL